MQCPCWNRLATRNAVTDKAGVGELPRGLALYGEATGANERFDVNDVDCMLDLSSFNISCQSPLSSRERVISPTSGLMVVGVGMSLLPSPPHCEGTVELGATATASSAEHIVTCGPVVPSVNWEQC
jgi:hypothetical protein